MRLMRCALALLFVCGGWPVMAQLQFGPASQSTLESVDDIALVINQEAIPRSQFNQEMMALRQQFPRDTGLPEDQIQEALLNQIIQRHLIAQLARQVALSVDEADVNKALAQVANQNGLTTQELLARVQQETGLGAEAYRQQVREQLVQGQLKQRLVGGSIHISAAQIDDQIAQIARQRGSELHLQDLLIPVPRGDAQARGEAYQQLMRQLSDALAAHDNDLQAAASEIPGARFTDLGDVNLAQIPIQFARVVATLPTGQVVDAPVVDRDGMHFLKVVSKSVGENGSGYDVVEGKLRHILIRRNPENPEAARLVIDEIYNRLQQGVSFATLARGFSQDVASAAKGGELGWMSADQLDPQFARQMETVPLKTISPPFESSFGWHIIEVDERRLVDRSEEKIREQIRTSLYDSALEEAWQQRLAEVRQSAYISIR